MFEKVLEVQEQIYPPNHVNIGNTLNNLGAAFEDANNLDRALLVHQRALKIF
jgi:hypothetical protein